MFKGHDVNITSQIILSFKNNYVIVDGLTFKITKDSIAKITSLPCTGDRWFKKMPLPNCDLNFFLKPKFQNPKWSSGIPHHFLLPKWKEVVSFVHFYLTYEGRYTSTYLYHMRFLIHLASFKTMNLPFFLHHGLLKMIKKARTPDGIVHSSVFHQGLIKILCEYEFSAHNAPPQPSIRKLGHPFPRKSKVIKDQSSKTSLKSIVKNKTSAQGGRFSEGIVVEKGKEAPDILKADPSEKRQRTVREDPIRERVMVSQKKSPRFDYMVQPKERKPASSKKVQRKSMAGPAFPSSSQSQGGMRQIHTRPKNKLRLSIKAKSDPKLLEPSIISDDEDHFVEKPSIYGLEKFFAYVETPAPGTPSPTQNQKKRRLAAKQAKKDQTLPCVSPIKKHKGLKALVQSPVQSSKRITRSMQAKTRLDLLVEAAFSSQAG